MHLNYHHLHYFWAVAKEGHLTRTAKRLRVSPSALSAQIRQLEDQLGAELFARQGRSLVLTEAGRIALVYADEIFASGSELLATLRQGRREEHPLRIGAVATLSRNFQESFVKPWLGVANPRLVLVAGSLDDLLTRLATHALDLVLSNRPVQGDADRPWRCRRVARQPVSLVGRPRSTPFRFPDDLRDAPVILPGPDSDVRTAFDTLRDHLDLRLHILAEVDDMAMLRLLARDSGAMVLVPSVVVRDELTSGVLQEYCLVPGLYENFYAITVERQFQHPLLVSLLLRNENQILDIPDVEVHRPAPAWGPRADDGVDGSERS